MIISPQKFPIFLCSQHLPTPSTFVITGHSDLILIGRQIRIEVHSFACGYTLIALIPQSKKSTDFGCVGLFLDFLFYFIALCCYPLSSTLQLTWISGNINPPTFSPFSHLTILLPLLFHINFKISLSIFIKIQAGILLRLC